MKKLIALMAIILCSSCVTDHGNFTVLSNKIVDTDDFELEKLDKVKNVKGVDRSHIILFFPTKTNPNLSGALNDAFQQADGDVMTDVNVSSWGWWFYLYGQNGWTVEGDVVKIRGN